MKDTRLEDLASRYKKSVASRYRSISPAEISTIPKGRCFASPKIDGELWFVEMRDGKATLFARGGRQIGDAPVVTELTAVAARSKSPVVIAGELFAKDGNPRPRVGDVASALASGKHERLHFHAFDVVEAGNSPPPVAYEERLSILRQLLSDGESIGVVQTEDLSDSAKLADLLPTWVTSGKSEGMVVRSSSGEIYKVKPLFTLDAVVVGFTTRAQEPDQTRSLLLGLIRPDGAVLLIGACGNIPGENVRRDLLQTLLKEECESRFRHPSSDGSLYRFVKPTVVVEISCTDLQFEDSNGELIRRWVIHHESGAWLPIIDSHSVSMLHPVLSRVRTDKAADDLDARVSQLEERVIASGFLEKVAPRVLTSSTLVRREAWTKAAKGGTSVRKLLVWKTGKESQWSGWPAWVVHFTDYSPDRKTPLERTLRTATCEATAMSVANALVLENVKKGWEPAVLKGIPTPLPVPEIPAIQNNVETETIAATPKKAARKTGQKQSLEEAPKEASAKPKKTASKKPVKKSAVKKTALKKTAVKKVTKKTVAKKTPKKSK